MCRRAWYINHWVVIVEGILLEDLFSEVEMVELFPAYTPSDSHISLRIRFSRINIFEMMQGLHIVTQTRHPVRLAGLTYLEGVRRTKRHNIHIENRNSNVSATIVINSLPNRNFQSTLMWRDIRLRHPWLAEKVPKKKRRKNKDLNHPYYHLYDANGLRLPLVSCSKVHPYTYRLLLIIILSLKLATVFRTPYQLLSSCPPFFILSLLHSFKWCQHHHHHQHRLPNTPYSPFKQYKAHNPYRKSIWNTIMKFKLSVETISKPFKSGA